MTDGAPRRRAAAPPDNVIPYTSAASTKTKNTVSTAPATNSATMTTGLSDHEGPVHPQAMPTTRTSLDRNRASRMQARFRTGHRLSQTYA